MRARPGHGVREEKLMRLANTLMLTGALVAGIAAADQRLVATRVEHPPAIDGRAEDPAWLEATPITTQDPLAGIDITLRAVYSGDEVFVLAQFPDPTESREHKTMLWNPEADLYETGPTREDTLVLKWSMEPYPIDLTLSADRPYEADIWYWKSVRTDHAGYADDKHQIYGTRRRRDSVALLSKGGRRFFLSRVGDRGAPAYVVLVHEGYVGDKAEKHRFQQPTGSRADVRAKGLWKDGRWTIEFGRKLKTGHPDDVQFETAGAYQFGVSRYEIAGRPKDPTIDEPNFGSGEISETLWLVFAP